MADYSGFGDLGAILGGAGRGDAFRERLRENYDIERAREIAAQERLARIGREGLRPAVLAAFGDNPQGALVAQLMEASQNPSMGLAGPLADYAIPGRMDAQRGAMGALAAKDYTLYNALNAGAQGRSFEPVRDLGDVLVSSGAPLGSEMIVTPKAQADIDLARARIDTEGARQDRLARPAADRDGAVKVPNYTMPPASTLEQALTFTNDKGKVVPDYADMDNFRVWQAQQAATDPRYNDGDFALGQWLATRDERGRAEREAAQLKAAQRAERRGAPVMVDPANLGTAVLGPTAAAPADPAADLIAQANDAIARGADPAQVEQRLRAKMAEMGLDPR